MNNLLKYSIVFITFLTISWSSLASQTVSSKNDNKVIINKYKKIFNDVIDLIENNYVEETDKEKLFYNSFKGMLSSLDPHSGFLDPKDLKEMRVQTRGEFGGVGIEITMDKGLLKVVSPIDDTPAHKAGLQPKDYISFINGKSVLDMNISQAVSKIRGKIGTKVVLTIIRKGEKAPFDVSLVRSTIKIASVKYKKLPNNIGYFRITSFSQHTTLSLKTKIIAMKKKLGTNLSGMILDLRNNPGGLLSQAIGVSDLFLDQGVIVSTKARNIKNNQSYKAKQGDILRNIPMVVLINQGSASASEIVAGALQDHKRSIIMGVQSFGKGSVQTIIPLNKTLIPQGQVAVRITTSRYYTPSNKSIQALGITPDIIVEQIKLNNNNKHKNYVSEASLPRHLSNGAKSKKNLLDSKIALQKLYNRDYQLARAVDTVYALSVMKNKSKNVVSSKK